MRIAYLTDNATLGGGMTYLRQLAKGLPPNFMTQTFLSDNGECAARKVNAWRPDVIHINHLRALLQLFRNPFEKPKAPVVFTVHGIHLRKYDFLPRTFRNRLIRFVRLSLERRLYRKCAALIALTESDREEIRRLYGRDLNVVVIPNGIATEQLSLSADTEAEFAFICIGRLNFQKGQDVLLHAIARCADVWRAKGCRTIFIGGGETLDKMKGLAQELKIADLVSFAGEIPNASRFLSRGRILVAPSRWEGLPFLLLEAGQQKKLVIASDCSGNRDIITNDVSGILFPTEDVKALVDLLVRDFSPKDIVRLGGALESRVRSDFTVDRMLSATQSLYQFCTRV